MQTAQIANRSRIYGIEPKRRNGVNTAFMVATFCGQLIGTAAGNAIYARKGWIGSGSASVGFVGGAILIIVGRGPWEEGWVGWGGGWRLRVVHETEGGTGVAAVEDEEMGVADEEMGVAEKVLEEVAAREGKKSPLKGVEEKGTQVGKGEKSGRESRVDEVGGVKE